MRVVSQGAGEAGIYERPRQPGGCPVMNQVDDDIYLHPVDQELDDFVRP